LASLVAAGLVLLTGAFLTPLFTDLPEAVLGAIVIMAVRSFFRVSELGRYWRLQRSGFTVAMTALLGVLIFDLLPGLLMAVILSLLLYVWWAANIKTAVLGRMASPTGDRYVDITRHDNAEEIDGLLIVRPDGQLFFGNVKALRNEIVALVAVRRPQVVIVDLEFSESVGLALTDMLAELQPVLTRASVRLWFAGLHSQTKGSLVHLGGAYGSMALVVYDEVADAVGAYALGNTGPR
jgi:MFS superfamily sulfate permease-like transporter